MEGKKVDLSSLASKWPSSYVARIKVEEFSGGAVRSRNLANLDSKGLGPKGRIRLKRMIVYPVESLVAWLEERAKPVTEQ